MKEDEKTVLLNNYEKVRQELEEAKKKPVILQEKINTVNKQLIELEESIDAASRRKEESLIEFAAGDITETELKAARESFDQLIREKNEFEEFLSASVKANTRIQRHIADLSQKLNGCRHIFFNAVGAELKADLGDAGLRVNQIYAALNLGGGAGSYESFLRNLFPLPPHDEMQKIQKEILAKYEFKDA